MPLLVIVATALSLALVHGRPQPAPRAAYPARATRPGWIAAEDDVPAWLARLRAPTADERARAQRWLSRHLASTDLEALRGAVLDGGAEVRTRIALALSDEDRLVGLAVELAASSDAPVAAVGRSALVESIARWSPGWTGKPVSRDDALAKLARKLDRLVAVDPRTMPARPDLALEEIARLVPGAPQLALDPDLALADHPREPVPKGGEIVGTFERVVDSLARLHRAAWVGFDLPDGDESPGRPWVVVQRATLAANASAAERLAGWCERFRRAADPADARTASREGDVRRACARAIASSGWPAAIDWLETRWREAGDDAALDGVLLAAGRGLVARSLLDPEVQRGLWRAATAALQANPPDLDRADAIALALSAAGPRGPGGEDLAAIAAEGLRGASPREQWVRLVAIEGVEPASSAAVTATEALLRETGVPLPVAFQALRARAAFFGGSSPPPVRSPRDLLAWADGQERAEECVRLFLHLGVAPSADEAGAQASRALSPIGRLAELEWLVLAGEPAAAARRLRALAEEPERGGLGLETLTERTRRFAQRGEREALDRVLAAAREIDGAGAGAGARAGASGNADTGASAGAQRLDLLEILSGAGSPEVRARFLARAATPSSRLDLLGLGALAEGPSGEEARAILVRAVAAYTPGEDVVAGLEVALSGIRAARDDLAERDLVLAVRREAREGPPELRLRFAVDAWPARERPEPMRGRNSDRSLAGSTLR